MTATRIAGECVVSDVVAPDAAVGAVRRLPGGAHGRNLVVAPALSQDMGRMCPSCGLGGRVGLCLRQTPPQLTSHPHPWPVPLRSPFLRPTQSPVASP